MQSYSFETIFRRIKALGYQGFIQSISNSGKLPENLVKSLERYHILVNGEVCEETVFLISFGYNEKDLHLAC